ncbi:MAG: carboxymuconolactone decarboxylase family protein [Alphaproteobacteria bacterium]|nr:carboxymuconolactone decarboxylase family protein [Rhodospirillales bacterium]MCW9045168.1 carboxymuconolactone decarboxylase family protein [Alphaproteobacteria bacterium]
MSQEMFEKGKAMRSQVLGADYVDNLLENSDDFNLPFQEAVTEWCWGFVWGDETLPPKTRSMLNLTMLAALNRMTEWELHLKGAIKNGVTQNEIRAILHQITVYCGAPAGVECFRIANRIFAEKNDQ